MSGSRRPASKGRPPRPSRPRGRARRSRPSAAGRGARDPAAPAPFGAWTSAPAAITPRRAERGAAPWVDARGCGSSRRIPGPGSSPSSGRSARSRPDSAGRDPASKSTPIRGCAAADPPELVGLARRQDRRSRSGAARAAIIPRARVTISCRARRTNGAPSRDRQLASSQRHRRRQDVGRQQVARRTPPGRSPARRGTSSSSVRAIHMSARIRPVGVEQQRTARRPGREGRDVGGHQVAEPSPGVGAVHLQLPVGRTVDERAPVVERVHLLPGFGRRGRHGPLRASSQPWTSRSRPPRTLLVTNDYPAAGRRDPAHARGALEGAAARPGRRSWRPTWEGAEAFDAAAPYTIVREPAEFIWPTPATAARLDEVVGSLGVEVVLFGDAFPLAALGPRPGEAGNAVPGRRARVRLLALRDAGHARDDALHDVGGLARAGDVQRVHRADGADRRAGGGAGIDAVSGRGPRAFRPDLPTADLRERHGRRRPAAGRVRQPAGRPQGTGRVDPGDGQRSGGSVPDATLADRGRRSVRGARSGAWPPSARRGSVVFAGQVPEEDLPALLRDGRRVRHAVPLAPRRHGGGGLGERVHRSVGVRATDRGRRFRRRPRDGDRR